MNKILITGGAGFLGINLASYYLEKGWGVLVLDNYYRPGVSNNLVWLKSKYGNRNLKFIKGDVRDLAIVDQQVKKVDVVVHFAGQTAVTTSIIKPREDLEINLLGTFNVLEAVRRKNPKAVVLFASTNKVYGDLGRLNITEAEKRYEVKGFQGIDEEEPLNFYSPYGNSKGGADQYSRDYERIYKLKTIVFRQSCIYGEHQFGMEDQGWLAHFISNAIKNEKITIFGNGKQVRDVLFVSDFVQACFLAIEKNKKTAGEIFNIGGGVNRTISLIELVEMIENLKGKKVKIGYAKNRLGDQKLYISNIKKAERFFGFSPKVNVNEGVGRLYDWLNIFFAQ